VRSFEIILGFPIYIALSGRSLKTPILPGTLYQARSYWAFSPKHIKKFFLIRVAKKLSIILTHYSVLKTQPTPVWKTIPPGLKAQHTLAWDTVPGSINNFHKKSCP
jgi:hypothetical protein